MLNIPHLEWHVAHVCNFTCESCGHFSNHGHKSVISVDDLKYWYSLWNKRLAPRNISILGGEPLLNKDILEILELTKSMWDGPQLEFMDLVTNGFLLDRFPDLPRVIADNNITLIVSIHGDDHAYNAKMNDIRLLVNEWIKEYKIQVKFVDSYNGWLRFYKGFGNYMMPFEDGDPQASWDSCIAGQDCFQLLDGKIYKCAPLAYLPFQKQKYQLSNKWDHYLTYKPLEPGSTDDEVKEFFGRQAESYCAMCPKNPEMFKKQSPTLPRRYYRILPQ